MQLWNADFHYLPHEIHFLLLPHKLFILFVVLTGGGDFTLLLFPPLNHVMNKHCLCILLPCVLDSLLEVRSTSGY